MERIMIIGCGGSGKSTLARQLGDKLDLPVVHLDKLFWRPGWVHLENKEFDEIMQQEMAKDRWIMDGNFNRTIKTRLERCDTVIWLDFSRAACLMGVAKRILTTFGTVREDMGEDCPERIDLEFLRWVWNFNKNKRGEYTSLLKSRTDKTVHIFKNRRQVKAFLNSL